MLRSIDTNSKNISSRQADTSISSSSDEQALFDQFTSILDKIASSLSRVQKNQKNQEVSDLSAVLGQIVSPVTPNQTPVVRDVSKPSLEKESSARPEVLRLEDGVSTSATDSVVRSQSSSSQGASTAISAAQLARTASEAERSVKSQDSKGSTAEVVAPVATTISASAQLEAATEPSREGGANEESLPLDQQQHQEGLGESTGAEDPSLAPALAEGETANVHPSTIKSTGARQEIAQTLSGNQESGVKATTEQRSPAEGAEVQVAPSETSGTVSKESEAAESQVAESILLASGNGIALGTRSTRNTAVQTTEDLIARSIEALIHQNVLTVAGKPNLETSPLQRTIGTVSAANITQPSVNSAQSLVHGDTQRGAVVREKAASRELPRAAQLRTLEKVEHALKEVARSKDGKTISLRLDPPSLGTLKIDVTFRDNQLHARFVGESPQVNALLREQSHELQQMLRKAGVSAERIVISVASEGGVDLREGFELFDRNATQQFKEQNTSGSNERGSVSSGVMVDGGVTSGIVPVTPAVEDHWIA